VIRAHAQVGLQAAHCTLILWGGGSGGGGHGELWKWKFEEVITNFHTNSDKHSRIALMALTLDSRPLIVLQFEDGSGAAQLVRLSWDFYAGPAASPAL
jgi:hypothetical protein